MSRDNFAKYLAVGTVLAVATALAFPAFAQEATATATATADATKEAVENPYGPGALWASGDAVSRGVLIILVIMSLGTWFILLTKLIEQSRILAAAKEAAKKFWTAGGINEGIKGLKATSPFRFVAESGLKSIEHSDGALLEQIDLHTWVTMSIQRAVGQIKSDLQGGLSFLATVGSTAPFIGLFGTVWGILNALTAIGIAGQPSIDKVAGPVGEALYMTAFGLFVAVPAVLAYNYLVSRNKIAVEKVSNFGADLHEVLLAAADKSGVIKSSKPRVA